MYKVVINDQNEFEVELTGDGAGTVNGKVFSLDVASIGRDQWHVISNNKSYRVSVVKMDPEEKTVTLRINGNQYKAGLKDKYDLLAEKLGMAGSGSARLKEFKAPMPGLVLDIFVKEGDTVKKGEQLAVLEAMKMENVLKATGDGVVKRIHVKNRQAVEKNQVMVTFE